MQWAINYNNKVKYTSDVASGLIRRVCEQGKTNPNYRKFHDELVQAAVSANNGDGKSFIERVADFIIKHPFDSGEDNDVDDATDLNLVVDPSTGEKPSKKRRGSKKTPSNSADEIMNSLSLIIPRTIHVSTSTA